MRSEPEHRVHKVPPCDVVTVLCGAVVGGGGGAEVADPVEVGGGATPLEERVVEGGALEGAVLRVVVGRFDGTVVPSSRSTARADRRATPEGATRLAACPTAANANATLTVAPTNHRQVRRSTRRISRLSPKSLAGIVKPSTRRPQLCCRGSWSRAGSALR